MATRRNSAAGDLRWLALAVVAHAAILLLPIDREAGAPSQPRSPVVELTLFRSPGPERDTRAPEPDAKAPQPQPQLQSDLKPNPDGSARARSPRREPAGTSIPQAGESSAAPSAAALLELARESDLDRERPAPARRLGLPVPQESPPALQTDPSPLGARLAEAYAPASPEIVDRWLAADGSHNVVVNLPNGETVCGRGEAWDPMRPLVEHVMMFRTCAGGGERTFTVPQNTRPAYVFPD